MILCLRLWAPEALYFRVIRSPVRPKPEILFFTCTWVRWSIRPTVTVTVFQPVRPVLRPDTFPGISRRTHGGDSLKFAKLMYVYEHSNYQHLAYLHNVLLGQTLVNLYCHAGTTRLSRRLPGRRREHYWLSSRQPLNPSMGPWQSPRGLTHLCKHAIPCVINIRLP